MSIGDAGQAAISKIIGVAVSLLVVALIFPMAIDELVTMETADWPTALETLLQVLLPVLAVIGVVLYIYPKNRV